jgi:MoaA/NifB/PqqE/SkfB family radical SAM enzyme
MALSDAIREYQETRSPADRGTLCHAPFVSLNFEQNGNATACCYNRKYVLGRYPDSSLAEIWEGEKIRGLRAALEAGDFSKGCELCLEQMESRNFAGMRARFFDGLRGGAADLGPLSPLSPKIIEFELSNTCNLECVMCSGYFSSSIRRNREKLPPIANPYDEAFVDQLKPYLGGLVWAKFLGGEPFLNPLYFKIWEAIVESGSPVKTVITTNGTILTPKIERLIGRLKPYLVLSIDSLQKESYERVRRNATFEEMRANLDWFIEYAKSNGRTVDIVVCPIRENWRDMPELFRFCQQHTLQIGINTVNWPEAVSLRSSTACELGEIAGHLRESDPYAREADPGSVSEWEATVFRNNRSSYRSLVNQVESWRAAATSRQAGAGVGAGQ